MKKKKWYLMSLLVIAIVLMISRYTQTTIQYERMSDEEQNQDVDEVIVAPSKDLIQLEDGLSYMQYDGEYGFQSFIEAGGAATDEEVVQYLMNHVVNGIEGLSFSDLLFGCSTLSTRAADGAALFGRNFDWQTSNALILQANPKQAYASISTINLDFIQSNTSISLDALPDEVLAIIAMYAPLDGMNEMGLVVSVNMIEDSDVIGQQGSNRDLTTTTAIRLILNEAADVEEAIALLKSYNLHSSQGMMVHFAIADAAGNSVVVEYVNDEMRVIETPVVTNFYLSEGEKYGIGSSQSHERYDRLMNQLQQQPTMDMIQVRDALDSVSKDNFNEFESTEWSIVYHLQEKLIHYYHREQYEKRYVFQIDSTLEG